MLVLAYLAAIVATNALIPLVGVIPLGFGIMAPAAVLGVGAVLVLRDVVQERHGARVSLYALLGGAALTAAFAPALAAASVISYLVAGLVDLAIYTPIRARYGLVRAALASNAVSIPVDSVIFLSIAFGSLAFMPGQIVGKAAATVATVAALALLRRARA